MTLEVFVLRLLVLCRVYFFSAEPEKLPGCVCFPPPHMQLLILPEQQHQIFLKKGHLCGGRRRRFQSRSRRAGHRPFPRPVNKVLCTTVVRIVVCVTQ